LQPVLPDRGHGRTPASSSAPRAEVPRCTGRWGTAATLPGDTGGRRRRVASVILPTEGDGDRVGAQEGAGAIVPRVGGRFSLPPVPAGRGRGGHGGGPPLFPPRGGVPDRRALGRLPLRPHVAGGGGGPDGRSVLVAGWGEDRLPRAGPAPVAPGGGLRARRVRVLDRRPLRPQHVHDPRVQVRAGLFRVGLAGVVGGRADLLRGDGGERAGGGLLHPVRWG